MKLLNPKLTSEQTLYLTTLSSLQKIYGNATRSDVARKLGWSIDKGQYIGKQVEQKGHALYAKISKKKYVAAKKDLLDRFSSWLKSTLFKKGR